MHSAETGRGCYFRMREAGPSRKLLLSLVDGRRRQERQVGPSRGYTRGGAEDELERVSEAWARTAGQRGTFVMGEGQGLEWMRNRNHREARK